jgi:hypothetical protein
MSYEYFTPIDVGTNVPLLELVELSGLKDLAMVISTKENEIHLRWVDTPVRSDWPEDITITRDDEGIFAIFHVGARADFLLALSQLSKAASNITGRPIKFLEI